MNEKATKPCPNCKEPVYSGERCWNCFSPADPRAAPIPDKQISLFEFVKFCVGLFLIIVFAGSAFIIAVVICCIGFIG